MIASSAELQERAVLEQVGMTVAMADALVAAREADPTQELAANASDYEKLTTLGAQLRSLQSEKAGLEDRWLTVAASLDE